MFAEHNTSGALSMLYSSDFKLLTFERNTPNMMSELCFSTFYATHNKFSACLSSRYAVDRGISLTARYHFSRSLFTWCIPFCWTYKAWSLRLSGMWGRVAGGCCWPKFRDKIVGPSSNILIPLGLLEHWRWHQYVVSKRRGLIIYCRSATYQKSGDVDYTAAEA